MGLTTRGTQIIERHEIFPIGPVAAPTVPVQVALEPDRSGNILPILAEAATEPEHGVESAPTVLRPAPRPEAAAVSEMPAELAPVAAPPPEVAVEAPAPEDALAAAPPDASLTAVAAAAPACAEPEVPARPAGPPPLPPPLPTPVRSAKNVVSLPRKGEFIAGMWEVEELLGLRGPVAVLSARCLRSGARVALRVLLGGPRPDAEELLMPQEHCGRVLQQEFEAPLPFVAIDYLPEAVSFWATDQASDRPTLPPAAPLAVARVAAPPVPPRGVLVAMAAGLALRLIIVAAVVAALAGGAKSAGAASPDDATPDASAPDTAATASAGLGLHATAIKDRTTRLARALVAESEEHALRAAMARVDIPMPVPDPSGVSASGNAPSGNRTALPSTGARTAVDATRSAASAASAAAAAPTSGGSTAAAPPAAAPPRAPSKPADPMDRWQ